MSTLTDLQALLAQKLAEYAAASSHPTHSQGGRSMDHTGQRTELLASIKELRLLIIQETGGQEFSTIGLG
jgi:hypothetical protein